MNLAVGFFDGVHLGHRRILACADAALTFRNHPSTIFAPGRAPALLMTLGERLATIERSLAHTVGFDGGRVRALDFTRELADEPPDVFATWLRTEYPRLDMVFCGPNWTFGRQGRGNAALLRSYGFKVEEVPFVEQGGEPVSSTRIRAAVAVGDMKLATLLLGRPWSIAGEATPGKGRGRELGFPTLNLPWPSELVCPPLGAYAVTVNHHPAVANLGLAPSMGASAWKAPMLEVHVLDNQVPSGRLVVELRRFLRPERSFPSMAELRAQIAADVAAVRAEFPSSLSATDC